MFRSVYLWHVFERSFSVFDMRLVFFTCVLGITPLKLPK